MDPSGLRARTTLVCGALALAIAVSMLLRGRVRKEHVLFAAFAGDIGLWYLSQSLFGFFQAPVWERLRVVLALLLPLLAIELFEAMVPAEDGRRSRLGRIGALVASPIVILVIVQQHRAGPVGVVVLLYVFAMSTAALWELGQRGARSHSRATQRRVRLLVIIGVLAGLGSAGDFAWVIGFDPPPVGVALTVVFVFVLGQAVLHRRLLDLGEMLSRLVVAIAMASLFAVFFYVLVAEIGQFNTMYVNAVLAAVIVLALFNPLHQKLEELIKRFVLRDPESLAASVAEACRKLTHVLELEEMGRVVVAALERSRSVTTAALYLRREDADGFERLAGLGAATPARLDGSEARPLWEKLEQGALLLEPLAQQIREQRQRGSGPHPDEAVLCAADVLGSPLSTGVVLGVRAEDGELLGLLGVTDERIREAFSPEDVAQLELLAGQ
ncbi:MAG: two-component system sensor protein, partial [Deltaproteobacteria bacterium]|nr:two-component system sensor protein [Deltaproteobacteria bacterium]